MTVRKLLNKIHREKPSGFTEAEIIEFINDIESDVAEELRLSEAPVYSDNHTDLDEELLVPAPYDRLYVSYVKAMIDYSHEEYASYQLNQEQHLQDYKDFADWVVRTGQAFNWIPTKFRNIL